MIIHLPAKTAYTMHHAALSTSTSNLGGHVEETVNLTMKITIWDIPTVFAPFAREYASFGGILWHRRYWVSYQRKLPCLIEESSSTTTSGE